MHIFFPADPDCDTSKGPMFRNIILAVSVSLLFRFTSLAQGHVVHAARATTGVVVDGNLSEPVWLDAVPETEFTQRDPDEGKPPTEKTDLRIAFDDANIYFGIHLYDSEPVKIVRRLSRRDDDSNADNFTIQLSPYHDKLTGVVFEISAAGVQRDAIISNDVNMDYSWEGVWESAVRIVDDGWIAEIRIPFSQLRFPKSAHQIWGINAARYIHRRNESDWLRLVAKVDSGVASRMDDLQGIDGIESQRHLELMPYIANRNEFIQPSSPNDPFNDGSRSFVSTGLDIKYGLSSNITLDATVNPDFGQVEVDPAVVNLSAFETFFPEKRPFFLEGSDIFGNFGQGGANNFFGFNRNEPNIFYSRRIGRAPQGSASGDFVDQPAATTILGAGKLTGKTRGGWTFGLIEAATTREWAKSTNGVQHSRTEVEPFTNYYVARVQREKNRVAFGFLTTGVQRDLRDPALRDQLTKDAYVFGGDGHVFLDSRHDWVVTGKLSGSTVEGSASTMNLLQLAPQHYFQRPDAPHLTVDPDRTSMHGWTGSINLNKNQGDKTLNAALWGVSPGFESNDIGFQTGGDVAGAHIAWVWKKQNPDRVTRFRNLTLAKSWTWNYGRQKLNDGVFVFSNATFLNYWSVNGSLGLFREVKDDHLTRGGPLSLNPASYFANAGFSTDGRKKVSFNTGFSHSGGKSGSWDFGGNVGINIRPTESISLSTGPDFTRSRNVAQYVDTVSDPAAVRTYGNRYVFSDLDQSQVSLTTRVSWILGPKMSLQVFAQPLISVGRYWDFKEFAQRDTFSFLKYGRDIGQISLAPDNRYTVDPDGLGLASAFNFDNPDFNFKSLRVNAVFRWEWTLGSTLYLVWTENRQDLSNPGQFSPRRDAGRLFSARPDDIFLVRFSYWLSR